MKKKIVSLLLCGALMAGIISGCGNDAGNQSSTQENGQSAEAGENSEPGGAEAGENSEQGGTGEIENITIMLPTMGQEPVDMQKVVDAMNAITEAEIGIHADYIICSGSDYSQQVSMKMSGGESLDLIQFQGLDFNSAITQNQFMPLNDLIDSYGADLKTAIPELYMDACTYNGTQYLIPVVRAAAAQPVLVLRKDMAAEAGWDNERLGTIKTAEDFEKLLADVREKYPDLALFSPLAAGAISGPGLCPIDGLMGESNIDGLNNAMGVLFGDSSTVENYFASDLFAQECDLMQDWYNKGYIWKEALTSSTNAIDTYLFSGTLFCFAFSSATDAEEPFDQPESPLFANAPSVNIPLGRARVDTTSIINFSLAIPTTSKHPEAAMKYLNFFYNSPEMENLLCHGIEGEHYTLDENGMAVKTENGNNNYTQSFNMYLGNGTLMYETPENGEPGYIKESIDMTVQATHSKALGYMPDLSANSVETVAITNVCSKYLGGLLLGSVDPSTELPKFLEELEEAGLSKVIEVKQQQLDEFLAN